MTAHGHLLSVDYVLVTQIAQKSGSQWAQEMFLIRCYKHSYFPPDVDKYNRYEKILYSSGFGQLCRRLCTLIL